MTSKYINTICPKCGRISKTEKGLAKIGKQYCYKWSKEIIRNVGKK